MMLIYFLIGEVLSGVEYFAFDLSLSWTFPTPDSIAFTFSVPISYRSAFGWAGIALQDAQDARDNFRCDYYIALLSNGLMTDRYAEVNGFSRTDEDQGGTMDLVVSSEEDQDYFLIKFERMLNTGDPFDVVLYRDRPVMVKYALGPVINGNIEQHSFRFNGLEYLILSEDYYDDNRDERRVYGPWMVNQYQNLQYANN